MDRNKLRKMLPHGSIKEIAKLAGVSSSAVTNYFNGRNNSYKVEIATMKIVQKYESERRNLIHAIESV